MVLVVIFVATRERREKKRIRAGIMCAGANQVPIDLHLFLFFFADEVNFLLFWVRTIIREKLFFMLCVFQNLQC